MNLFEFLGVKEDDIDLYEVLVDGYRLPENIEFIKQDGGHEGGGEYCYTILKNKETDQYLKAEYAYFSYQGFDFDYLSCRAVVPKQVTETQYV